MNRRTACGCFLTAFQTLFTATLAMATEQAARAVQRIPGPHWNVNGDWNPSLEAVQSHLRDAHGIDPSGLGRDQLLILHDNAHNRAGQQQGQGRQRQSSGSFKGYRRA
jgi:hypothetical protein